MQTYNVEIPQSVQEKIEAQALYIAQDKPSVAMEWYDTIHEKMQTLATAPERCPKAPESQLTDFKIQHLIIGNYRVLFCIEEDTVIVLDFKRSSQNKPG